MDKLSDSELMALEDAGIDTSKILSIYDRYDACITELVNLRSEMSKALITLNGLMQSFDKTIDKLTYGQPVSGFDYEETLDQWKKVIELMSDSKNFELYDDLDEAAPHFNPDGDDIGDLDDLGVNENSIIDYIDDVDLDIGDIESDVPEDDDFSEEIEYLDNNEIDTDDFEWGDIADGIESIQDIEYDDTDIEYDDTDEIDGDELLDEGVNIEDSSDSSNEEDDLGGDNKDTEGLDALDNQIFSGSWW